MRFPTLIACLLASACSGASFNVADPPDALPEGAAQDDAPAGDGGGVDVVHDAQVHADAAVTGAEGASDACVLYQHDDGYGETWQSCVPTGTYDKSEAELACARHTGDASECGYVHFGPDAICSNMGAALCACWGYDGAIAGEVNHGEQGCELPGGTLGTSSNWN